MSGDFRRCGFSIQQERGGAEEGAGGKGSAEQFDVFGVEVLPESQVGGEDLDPDEVVPGHAGGGEDGGESGKQEFKFAVDFGRSDAGSGIDADASGEIKRVSDQDGIAERQAGTAAGKVDEPTSAFRGWHKSSAPREQRSGILQFPAQKGVKFDLV